LPADIDASQYGSLVHLLEEGFSKYAARKAYVGMGRE
jgi:long-chain acyl-CoA synthetase